jgi:hypothetical protein
MKKLSTPYAEFYKGSVSFKEGKQTFHALIFASDKITSKILDSNQQLFVDATFSVVPDQFSQLLNVMLDYKGTVIPVFHILMTGKKKRLFRDIFQNLKYNYPAINPTVIMSDFELALARALKIIFPDSRIAGCRFHFSQAIFRNLNGAVYKLHHEYKKNSMVNRWLRKVMALPLLPEQQIKAQLRVLKDQIVKFPTIQLRQKLRKFHSRYFKR